MKTAIYIEDGVVQLVVTPESEFEKNAIGSIAERVVEARLFAGSFYDCRGGWVSQVPYTDCRCFDFDENRDDKSLIIKITNHALAPAQ